MPFASSEVLLGGGLPWRGGYRSIGGAVDLRGATLHGTAGLSTPQ